MAVANSLLSIGGAGVAAWYACSIVGWRDEWRMLFALFVAAVVAVAEGVLFVIWDSRRNKTPRVLRRAVHKKDHDEDTKSRDVVVKDNTGLRRRAQMAKDKEIKS